MSTVFFSSAHGGKVNAAHVVYVDLDNIAHMSDGNRIELTPSWCLPSGPIVLTRPVRIEGLVPLTCNLEKIVCLLDTHFNGHP